MANASLGLLDAICSGRLPAPPEFQLQLDCPPTNTEAMYSLFTKILMTTIFSSLSVVGVVGNLLVITVVLQVKGMKTPTNYYLVSLALSDTLFFIATAPTELSYLHTPVDEYIFGSVGCALFTYLPYLAINSSSLSITAFTVERFIGICYPYRARTMCTVKRARLIILCIWIFSLLYNSPWLYLASVIEDAQGSFCSFKLDRANWTYKVMFLGDFFAFYTIPMLLNIVIYGTIAVTLSQCDEKFTRSKKVKGAMDIPTLEAEKHIRSESHVSGKRKTAGKYQVVKMLAVVVIIFATCWFPYRAMVMYNSFAEKRWDPDWFIFFSKTLIFINCAINPILYNLMSAKFRSAFRALYKQGFGLQRRYHPVDQKFSTTASRRRTEREEPAVTQHTLLTASISARI